MNRLFYELFNVACTFSNDKNGNYFIDFSHSLGTHALGKFLDARTNYKGFSGI